MAKLQEEYREIVRSVPNTDCSFQSVEIGKGFSMPFPGGDHPNRLLFVLSGKIRAVDAGGAPTLVPEGRFTLFPREFAGKITAVQSGRLLFFRFNKVDHVWTSNKIRRLLEAVHEQPAVRFPVFPVRHPLEAFLKLIVLYMEEKELNRSFYALKDNELLSLLYSLYGAGELGRLFYPVVHTNLDFKSFVEANCLKVENASELAELAGCSLVTLNRKFREYFNDTAYQWIMKNKMGQIKKRLENTATPLSEIAKEFGFYSGSELNRFCQRQFGTSALKLRKQLTGKIQMK